MFVNHYDRGKLTDRSKNCTSCTDDHIDTARSSCPLLWIHGNGQSGASQLGTQKRCSTTRRQDDEHWPTRLNPVDESRQIPAWSPPQHHVSRLIEDGKRRVGSAFASRKTRRRKVTENFRWTSRKERASPSPTPSLSGPPCKINDGRMWSMPDASDQRLQLVGCDTRLVHTRDHPTSHVAPMQWNAHDVSDLDHETVWHRIIKDAVNSTDIGNYGNNLHANPCRRSGQFYFSFKAVEKSSSLLNFSQVNAESVRPK